MSYIFNKEKELGNPGKWPQVGGAYGKRFAAQPRFDTPITPRENVLRVCRRERPVWLPNLPVDCNFIQPEIMPDAYARIHGGTDWFGIQWQYEPTAGAGMVKPGTRRLSDITNWEKELVFPDLEAIDWAADYAENYRDMPLERATVFCIVNGCFERLADLTSFGDALCYFLEEQEAVRAFFTRLTDWHIQLMGIAKKYYHADIITFHDDMGSQRECLMSPDIFREVLMPHYVRMNRAAHEMGLYVNFHSCGCVGRQIENFAACGFDFWEGQATCNDLQGILDRVGDRMGQVSRLTPAPELSDEAYAREIYRHVHERGASGHYICWFVEKNPNRAVDGNALLYAYSREMYLQQENA